MNKQTTRGERGRGKRKNPKIKIRQNPSVSRFIIRQKFDLLCVHRQTGGTFSVLPPMDLVLFLSAVFMCVCVCLYKYFYIYT